MIEGKISRQALHNWYTDEAIIFFQSIFAYISKIRIKEIMKGTYLDGFSSILICDSTWLELTKGFELEKFFDKFGGKYSKSTQCKVQLVFDYLTGAIKQTAITKSTANDPSFHEDLLALIKEGTLLIVDLGYFSLEFFSQINEKGAYFISRLKFGITVYHSKTKEQLNLLRIAKRSKENEFEFKALLGVGKFESRIIGVKAPAPVAKTRREKYKDNCRRQRRKVNLDHLEQLGWSFFITNISEKIMPAAQIILLYSIRWQIELIIKMLKSIISIDFTMVRKNVKRIICEIYGRLILASFLTKVHSVVKEIVYEDCEIELSLDKMLKRFTERAFNFTTLLLRNIHEAIDYLMEILKLCSKTCLKERQGTRMTPREKILKMPLKSFTLLTCDYLTSLS